MQGMFLKTRELTQESSQGLSFGFIASALESYEIKL